MLYLLVFVKAVSPPSFFLLPSPFLNAFTAHICRLHTHINICFAHIECHSKSRGVKTTRRQSVGPAQQGATQPARNVAFDDEAEAPSKMKGSVSVSLSSHTAPLHQHPRYLNKEVHHVQHCPSFCVALDHFWCSGHSRAAATPWAFLADSHALDMGLPRSLIRALHVHAHPHGVLNAQTPG